VRHYGVNVGVERRAREISEKSRYVLERVLSVLSFSRFVSVVAVIVMLIHEKGLSMTHDESNRCLFCFL